MQQKIWRFIDFEKYENLLKTSTLYFARSDVLGDELEGTRTDIEKMLVQKDREKLAEMLHWNEQDKQRRKHLDSATDRDLLQHIFVNCWHMYDEDSKVKWDMHLEDKRDIAIQSTYMKLRESVEDSKEVSIGKVRYRDLNIDINERDNFFRYVIRKDKRFQDEKELRAIVNNWVDEKGIVLKKPLVDGLQVSVDLDLLMERVYVSSSCSSSFLEKTREKTEKYGFSNKVERSIV
jgi:hypothetical protein